MFRLARLSAAALLGLLMAVTLLVPAVFAQRVDTRQGNLPSTVHQVVLPMNHSSTHCGGCGWGGWDGGWGGWGGGWDGGWGW